jgi:RHS repeat-associated protein
MLTAAKEEMFSRPMVWTKECALPLAATGVYAKTRVWGSEPENLHCFSATAPVKIELRWGCEESSGKTAAGSGVTFKYDPFGRRIYKQSPNATSIFVYDGANLIETVSATGGTVARYTQGQSIDEPLAMQRGTATDYYEADGLGSITSLTDPTGAVAQGYTYDSFGNQTNSTGTLRNYFRYTAREFDTETNLYYYRARYYDPATGRFLNEDPLKFSAGINFYAYVKNKPIDFLDPYGLQCTQVTPWQQIPTMSAPGSLKPYATVQDGLFWVPVSWDFVGGDGTSSCICNWIATNVRIRKFYRKNVQEEAWFQCPGECGNPPSLHLETRTITKEWVTNSPGAPIWSPQVTHTNGPTLQPGGSSHAGGDPNQFNTECTACFPSYNP